jgi:UDP-glucose 4-epimerase
MMDWLDKNILVTGGAGFIGSHLVDFLVDKRAKVTVIDNLKDGRMENLSNVIDKVSFEKGDVRDGQKVNEIIDTNEIEIVFHLAANANVPYSVEHPRYDFETNAVGSLNVLESCRDNQVEKMIYASSAAVYGEPKYTPMDENHPLKPISPYGASKLAGEKLGFAYHRTYGLSFVSMRIFNTYGPRQRRYVMYDLLRKLRENQDHLEVLGTGDQTRDYCYVLDTANAFLLAAEKEEAVGQAFNVAGGNSVTIRELAEIIVRILELGGTTEIQYTGESWKGDIVKLVADISKIKRLGFEPQTGLEEGISKLKNWFEKAERC